MLRAYSTNITSTTNTPITFNTNKILIGNSVTHSSNSSNFSINNPRIL